MNILLISQCNKRALTETRRILDQFAERRGDRTWQTAITLEGLHTLHKLLRKTARKNTAVACHWIRGRDHSELMWIVGDASQFNFDGATPTNTTQRNILRAGDENDWHSAEDIRLLASLAALFHDFGKANLIFQNKLKKAAASADPYRHEWISLRLFEAFVGNDSDEVWLQRLCEVDSLATAMCIKHLQKDGLSDPLSPFRNFPPLAQVIGWLIVSHHRVPTPIKADAQPQKLARLPLGISADWCGARSDVTAAEIKNCWSFKQGLPFDSQHWCRHVQKLARQMLIRNGMMTNDWCNNAYVMHLSRMTLMLADHYYSGQQSHPRYGDKEYPLHANTDRKSGQLKQRLDEHLIGVEVNASRILKTLLSLQGSLPSLGRHKGFRQRSKDRRFAWQDKAFDLAEGLQGKSQEQGFFGVNMASTGCGKTLANGRIMYALANAQHGARFTIALGLRALTLQTGDAYRQRLQLTDADLAVMVGGGAAVKELHQLSTEHNRSAGSDSGAALMPEWQHVHFDGSLEGPLNHWLQADPQAGRLLNAPIVTCTIDHLMPATEGTRGGHQIPPMLRLMTSDLVLDEPDDFAVEDLPALARLVNWAGLLGSRVLLSSATLPPALIQGLFDAYLTGRAHYQKSRGIPGQPLSVCCAWFDEFNTSVRQHHDAENYLTDHQLFVNNRLQKLAEKQQTDNRRKALIQPLESLSSQPEDERYPRFAAELHRHLHTLHRQHCIHDPASGKKLSIGVIRMANINPLVETARALFTLGASENTRIHLCVYHSQHPLLVRSAIERKLDHLLTRHNEDDWLAQQEVRNLLDNSPEADQIVVILATAVAEVGRDHDYDWGIVEPSSMRSIIQLAGRIRRHRPGNVNSPNLYLLDTNLRYLRQGGSRPAFCKPGFESEHFMLNSHYLHDLLTPEQWQQIDASSRISQRAEEDPHNNLVDLEHDVIQHWVQGADSRQKVIPASAWWHYRAPLSGILQRKQPFRFDPNGRQRYFLLPGDDELKFVQLGDKGILIEAGHLLSMRGYHGEDREGAQEQRIVPWGAIDYLTELEDTAAVLDLDIQDAARRFGYIDLPQNGCDNGWYYHPALGFSRKS